MSKTHLKTAIRRSVSPSISESLRSDQVQNSAGGFVWEASNWTRLRRFLVLGTAGGTYYIGERDLTKEGLDTIKVCLRENGPQTVQEILDVSDSGRAPKNDYAIFALAVAVAVGDDETKTMALNVLPMVARIGTHLFQFVDHLEDFGCLTGRAKRRALAKWYATKDADKLAYEVIKFRQREGWSHRDVLRLAHAGSRVSSGNPTVDISDDHKAIFDWVTKGAKSDSHVWNREDGDFIESAPLFSESLGKIEGFETIQRARSADEAAFAIEKYGLPREAVPTEFLKETVVWDALLSNGMPMTAMIRNLGNMTKIGLLTSQSEATARVVKALKNEDAIRKARIHPVNVLIALKTYSSGAGYRGSSTWSPVTKIVNALDSAFYTAFGNVEPTGKRRLIALDTSGSMYAPVNGVPFLSCVEAESAMALVTEAVEPNVEIIGFNTRTFPMTISSRQRLDDVTKYVKKFGGGTNCSAPLKYALANKLEFDSIEIYTDSESWYGGHPAAALKEYRKASGIDARMVVVAMAANRFTVGQPDDPGVLDIAGLDTATPNLISDFVAGRI